ncbi:MAG: DUF1836 domain-containing protein [Clostridia bacterium]|nr:DUF1836 domain-containing protein [Clostridia bacterium]
MQTARNGDPAREREGRHGDLGRPFSRRRTGALAGHGACGHRGLYGTELVRRGYLTPPRNKRYTERQFCRIVLINLLRDSLNIGEITDLISRINGHLDDESDDLIDDTLLYVYFVRLLDACGAPDELPDAVRRVTADFPEPLPGAGNALREILKVAYLAYQSARCLRSAREALSSLPPYGAFPPDGG